MLNAEALKDNQYAQKLHEEISDLRQLIQKHNPNINTQPRKKSLKKMSALSSQSYTKLSKIVKDQMEIYGFASAIGPEKGEDFEVKMANKAAAFFNLQDINHLRSYIGPNDIIELYNDSGVQLYRSFSFFDTSCYALEDLLVSPWYELWERPSYILENLQERMGLMLSGHLTDIRVDLPPHPIKEIYQDENHHMSERTLMVKIKLCGPLKAAQSTIIGGFFCISECQVMEPVTDKSSIRFI